MLTLVGSCSFTTYAATPTPAQIAQFQKLPRAQQEQLARQFGIDMSVLQGQSNVTLPTTAENQAPVRTMAVPANDIEADIVEPEDKEEQLPLFGYDVLAGESEGYTAINNLPVPSNYVMAAGDSVEVLLFGKTSQSYSLEINREGVINFPEFGPLAVAGQTFAQMREQIINFVEQQVIGVNVTVTMGSMRAMQVYVVGELKQPGAYTVNGLTTVIQALIASGGVKETASLRNIQLKRKGKVVSKLDLYDLLVNGNSSGDVRLLEGDTLFVPTKKESVSIDGEILRPAVYELKGKVTLAKLIKLAGGLKPEAYLSKVSVRRLTQAGTELFTLDLSKSTGKNFVIENGDQVKLLPAASALSNVVTLRGEVVRQGAMTFTEGMKVTDAISSVEDDLKESADLKYALIVREINKNRDIEVLQFNLGKALDNPASVDNLSLEKRDQIFVFDNGVEQEFWFGNPDVAIDDKPTLINSGQKERMQETIDNETGAVIINDDATKLKIDSADTVSDSEFKQQSSREMLLSPIVDRLKAQSDYRNPAQLITITGAVKFPGTYPYSKKQSMEQLIVAAGGLLEQAYTERGDITRNIGKNGQFITKHYPFSLKEALLNKGHAELKAQDTVMIKTQPGWQKDMVIELQGEVMFPGNYTFQRGETLEDIIERAGGLTQFAYPEGAVFSRERLKRQEEERLKLLNLQLKQEIASLTLRRQSSNAAYTSSPMEALQVADELSNTEAVGRLVIDLPDAIKGVPTSNLMLEKGDKLYVPAMNPTVSIMGEVQYVSNQTFKPNMTVEQYIAAAGGTKKQADTDRIYVVRADGSVMLPNNSYWFSRNSEPLMPGDTIVVPIDTDYLDGLSTLTSATQILYQIGVAWNAIKN